MSFEVILFFKNNSHSTLYGFIFNIVSYNLILSLFNITIF